MEIRLFGDKNSSSARRTFSKGINAGTGKGLIGGSRIGVGGAESVVAEEFQNVHKISKKIFNFKKF